MIESTGDIVFVGKEEEDAPLALHIYEYRTGWKKIKTIPIPCIHEGSKKILPIMIRNNERLLVSCGECKTIWFCDLYTGKFSEALKEEWFYLGMMCKAEGDYIYIMNDVAGLSTPILKAKCTPTELTVDKSKTIYSKIERVTSICYLPDVKCIAISNWQNHVVKAIHCETDEQVWQVRGEVAGVTWKPHGLFYSQEHQSLLVCDGIDNSDNGRLVVLKLSDGSVLQVIPLPELGLPLYLSLCEGNLIVHNSNSKRTQINVFNSQINKLQHCNIVE